MTVGVGLPNSDLDIRSVRIKDTEAAAFIKQMIADEMHATESYIKQHIGVGVFEGHVKRWQYHMEVYAKLHEMVALLNENLVCSKRRRKKS